MRLRVKSAGLVVAATLILTTSPFVRCKPPRALVLEEGARDMGKPQVAVPTEKKEAEKDAESPRKALDSGDILVVPKKDEGKGKDTLETGEHQRVEFDLPKRKPVKSIRYQ